MKASILSMLVVLVLMAVIPIWLFSGDGFLRGGSGDSDNLKSLKDKTPKGVKTVVTDKEIEVYKWSDEHGVTQFSEVSPADGSKVEKIVLSPDTNVMDALKIPEEKAKVVQKPKVISLGSPYSPEGMKDIITDSLDLKEQSDEKKTEQDKLMEDLFKQK